MKNNILNAELISRNKFSQDDLNLLKEKMESREDFIIFYSIFMEVMELNFSGYLEIYLEDVDVESDLQDSIVKMLLDLDDIIPGSLSNDSKIEWISSQHISNVWYKDNNIWCEKTTDNTDRDFFDDEWPGDYDSFNDLDDNNW